MPPAIALVYAQTHGIPVGKVRAALWSVAQSGGVAAVWTLAVTYDAATFHARKNAETSVLSISNLLPHTVGHGMAWRGTSLCAHLLRYRGSGKGSGGAVVGESITETQRLCRLAVCTYVSLCCTLAQRRLLSPLMCPSIRWRLSIICVSVSITKPTWVLANFRFAISVNESHWSTTEVRIS